MCSMAPPDTDPPHGRMHRPIPAREAARTRRPDASMTLLVEVMEHPLDPGYAAAAADRAGRSAGGRRLSTVVTVLVALLCGWLTTIAVVELRRPQPEVIRARAALENEIQQRTAESDRLQRRNEKLRAQIADAQQAALAGGGGSARAERIRSLAVVTGELPVTGPGLELTLADAVDSSPTAGTDPRANGDAAQGRVMDRDLQIVVNGLWAAGAEAIAINGERLTALSAIRSAGQAILVDFRPLSPPYVVQALGDPKSLQSGFGEDTAGPYLKLLSDNYGVRAGMAAKTSLVLPGAGSLTLRYASGPATAATRMPSPSASGQAASSTSSAPTGDRTVAPTQEVSP